MTETSHLFYRGIAEDTPEFSSSLQYSLDKFSINQLFQN